MSKMDDLRAMREARYQQTVARAAAAGKAAVAKAPPAGKTPTAAKAPVRRAAPEPVAAPDPAESTEGLCGHRNMSGRTCTREHGHAAKSHRYS